MLVPEKTGFLWMQEVSKASHIIVWTEQARDMNTARKIMVFSYPLDNDPCPIILTECTPGVYVGY
jgi:hypothetical protein